MRTDVIVLGAGVVGMSCALQLARRGRQVTVVDRLPGAGEGTSHGNAGLVEASSVAPYLFPTDLRTLWRYALNRAPEARYHLAALHRVAPWLLRYRLNSTPERARAIAAANLPLLAHALSEHRALAAEAGVEAMLRPTGWIKMYRSEAALAAGRPEAEARRAHGFTVRELDRDALGALEPHLSAEAFGGFHMTEPVSVPDPGGLVKAYAARLLAMGGRLLNGDAQRVERDGAGWRVATASGAVVAPHAVVALGPWSDDVFGPLGYRIPLAVKRGYHVHLRPRGNAVLNHPVLDAANGFMLAPMSAGVRMTTGVEFALRDAPPSPVQVGLAEPIARRLLPIESRVEAEPWMGRRPCLPDMTPVIGPAPRDPGLWFAFGHHHHGLTNAPATGRLIAELIAGEAPFIDHAPYRADRRYH